VKPSGPGKPADFQVDPRVRKLLADWGRERGTEPGLLELGRQAKKLDSDQKEQLTRRLAEISLGMLFVLCQTHRPE
jgi:hypothetical protein